MNDEVKKILEEFLKEKGAYSLRYSFNGDLAYSQEQILKDYITNLQKENERLKKENTKLYKKDTKIINELKEELEITQEKWNKDKQWSECRTKEWLDYKSRCEREQ